MNNPLAGIVGYAQLHGRSDLDPSAARMVDVLKKQAERAGRIVQNFLSLATKTEPEKYSFDLNKVVENVLLLREYDHSVETSSFPRNCRRVCRWHSVTRARSNRLC